MYRIGREELDELKKVIDAKKLFMVGDPAAGHQQEVVRFEHEWAEKRWFSMAPLPQQEITGSQRQIIERAWLFC